MAKARTPPLFARPRAHRSRSPTSVANPPTHPCTRHASKESREELRVDVVEKTHEFVLTHEGVAKVAVEPLARRFQRTLSPPQIRTLCGYVTMLKRQYGCSVDCEFATTGGGGVVMLQVRPVTKVAEIIGAPKPTLRWRYDTVASGPNKGKPSRAIIKANRQILKPLTPLGEAAVLADDGGTGGSTDTTGAYEDIGSCV